jgi:hypothetical protein
MNKITDFFSTANKKPRLSEELTEETEVPESSTSTAGTSKMASTTNNDWPSYCSLEQKNDFCTEYEWLHVLNKNLAVRVVKSFDLSVLKKKRNENIQRMVK